jgi:hypothetical protein
MVKRISTCELEADACAEHIVNREELRRVSLEGAPVGERLVESLGLMWDEEWQRVGGCPTSQPLPGPPRDPQMLCAAVEAVRAQFQVAFNSLCFLRPAVNIVLRAPGGRRGLKLFAGVWLPFVDVGFGRDNRWRRGHPRLVCARRHSRAAVIATGTPAADDASCQCALCCSAGTFTSRPVAGCCR